MPAVRTEPAARLHTVASRRTPLATARTDFVQAVPRFQRTLDHSPRPIGRKAVEHYLAGVAFPSQQIANCAHRSAPA